MIIDTNLVRKLIDSQFPQWSELPIKPVERSGWDNRTFRLGNQLSVRLPSAESYSAQVHKEQRWLPYLGNNLSTLIPQVQALGKPEYGYPWSWSIYKWIEGEDVDISSLSKGVMNELAKSVALFINELHTVGVCDGPLPGSHNYHRGGELMVYDQDTKTYIHDVSSDICVDSVLSVWNRALDTPWKRSPVWIHGDLETTNILVSENKLTAVIDFGNCAVGDPACDLVMAWTCFDAISRHTFQSNLNLDDDTWVRGKAWALWKALFTMSRSRDRRDAEFLEAKRLVHTIVSSTP